MLLIYLLIEDETHCSFVERNFLKLSLPLIFWNWWWMDRCQVLLMCGEELSQTLSLSLFNILELAQDFLGTCSMTK